ncbi:hypothetical protein niasHT_032362 [Heterodera trifolii]|uniref:B30.2/SPRY domain-containing protein n=1 Tax=Heterodera trifolii TaxID=157864 RepID=A0ABD2HVE6_9BILA
MPFHQMPNPKNVDNGTETQADEQQAEVNESGGQSERIRGPIEVCDDEQQQMFNEKQAKTKNELNHSQQNKLLELEKKRAIMVKIAALVEGISKTTDELMEGTSAVAANACDTQIEHLKNSRQLKALRERIGELEKQQQQQMTIFHQLLKKCEKFSTLENFVVTALETQQMEQQQKQMQISQKFSVLENFVGISKDRFGNELLESVHPNVRPNFVEKFLNVQENCWDFKACHSELEIAGAECLTVCHKGKKRNEFFYSVFAKCAIPSCDSGIFYYEIRILHVKNFARIGLATKAMPLDRKVGSCADSFAYGNSGFIWMNNSCWINLENEFGNDDIVGCGINLTNRRVIFTKNGQRLDTADLFAPESICPLFPCVTLGSSNDKVEANFGPTFKFNLSKTKMFFYDEKHEFILDDYHSDLEINDNKVYYGKRNGKGWRSVFMDCPIAGRAFDAIFYFEMNVRNVEKFVRLGFAPKGHSTPKDGIVTATYSYRSDGTLWEDGTLLIEEDPVEQFVAGDTVGCGINLAMKRIIFTKNGRRIGATIMLDSPPAADPLFPFISLHDFGDLIKANFGLSFKFDPSVL